jgi:hypothetical protein
MIGTSAPGISASWPLLATMHDLCRHAQRCSGAAGAGSIIYASFLGRDGGCLCFAPPMAAELARKFRHLNLSLHVHVTTHVHQIHTSQICLHHLYNQPLFLEKDMANRHPFGEFFLLSLARLNFRLI